MPWVVADSAAVGPEIVLVLVVGRDVVFVDEPDWVVVSVDWCGVVAVLGELRRDVARKHVVFDVPDGVRGELGSGTIVEITEQTRRWAGKDSQMGE